VATVPKIVASTGNWHHVDVTESVDKWSTQSISNYGWIIIANETEGQQVYSSVQTTLLERRPVLNIDFELNARITQL
jgi:hypothetical protein